MNRLAMIAKIVFSTTFVILWIYLLLNRKFSSIAFFVVIFMVGFFAQRRTFFWKVCLTFFGFMSMISMFGVFGGLEPHSQGDLAAGNWFGFNLPLFVMSIFSTVLSFLAGLWSEHPTTNTTTKAGSSK